MIRFAPGAIVRLRDPRGGPWDSNQIEYVFVLVQPERPFVAAHPELRVAPICLDPSQATDVDLICAAGEGGLDQPFVVELWNQCAILVEELEPSPIGVVSAEMLQRAYDVHNSMVDDTVEVPAGVTGTAITDASDPRIAHQEHRAELAEALAARAHGLVGRTHPTVGHPATYLAVSATGLGEQHAGSHETLHFWPPVQDALSGFLSAHGHLESNETACWREVVVLSENDSAYGFSGAAGGNPWSAAPVAETDASREATLTLENPFQRLARVGVVTHSSDHLALAV